MYAKSWGCFCNTTSEISSLLDVAISVLALPIFVYTLCVCIYMNADRYMMMCLYDCVYVMIGRCEISQNVHYDFGAHVQKVARPFTFAVFNPRRKMGILKEFGTFLFPSNFVILT